MNIGEPLGLKPGHTSTIRRIEGGMLSYHADMTINTNPLELGIDKFIDLDGNYILIRIKNLPGPGVIDSGIFTLKNDAGSERGTDA